MNNFVVFHSFVNVKKIGKLIYVGSFIAQKSINLCPIYKQDYKSKIRIEHKVMSLN